jgi:hypothetical protein
VSGRTLASPPVHRRATDADRRELKHFACGAREEFEQQVDWAVREIARRRPARDAQLFVFRERMTDLLVGVAAAKPAPVGWLEGELVQVVALAAEFRGACLADGTRAADHLLTTLIDDVIQRRGREPHMFAFIARANRRSQELFDRNGYELTQLRHPHLQVWVREGEPSENG